MYYVTDSLKYNFISRLGERNCIEIVAKLISSKLLDVVFTVDGKEYVTPAHLTKELKDEAYVQGGTYMSIFPFIMQLLILNSY